MDDIKILPNMTMRWRVSSILQNDSVNIDMDFGLYKCAKVILVKAGITDTHSIDLDSATSIRELEQ